MTAGRKSNSQSQDWGTPEKYVEAVKEVFGGAICLDPCSNRYSIVKAITEYNLPEHDGLIEIWNYPTIYVNPPYGLSFEHNTSIKDWLRKCEEAYRLYGAEVIALIPVATNTGHWKKYIYGKATAICFLYDTRLKFLLSGKDVGKGAPMSCAMIYWGVNYQRFYDVFIKFGAVMNIINLKGLEIGKSNNSRVSNTNQQITLL